MCVCRVTGAADEPEITDALRIDDEEEILSSDVGENTEVIVCSLAKNMHTYYLNDESYANVSIMHFLPL